MSQGGNRKVGSLRLGLAPASGVRGSGAEPREETFGVFDALLRTLSLAFSMSLYASENSKDLP